MLGALFLWAFIGYGITSIIVWGAIFEKPRNWIINHSNFFGQLITCVLCTGTWVGFFMSICLGGLTNHFFKIGWLPSIFFDGVFTAGIVWAINAVLEFFEESRVNMNINGAPKNEKH